MMEMELVRVVEMEGKGRGLVASQPLRGGQIILKESPLLLYSAFPLNHIHSSYSYCGHCFKTLSFSSSKCSCCLEVFCSPHCLHSHSPSGWACQTLLRLRHSLSPPTTSTSSLELHQQARFLVAAYNLAINSPSQFQKLLSLHGSPAPDSPSAAPFLHPLLSPPPHTHFSVEISAALLAKDKLNAFGLMEPFSPDDTGKNNIRSVRAYGIYPNASIFNHDCLPNACRFDYVDGPTFTISNTEITVRMIHDVPAGREICISYFPVNLTYKSRQRRLMEDYGFACHCERCKVEANWSDQEEEDDDDDNLITEEEEEEEEDNVNMEEESENVSMEEEDFSFPHAYFFVRYMCNRNNCWGTLAPLPPSSQSQSKLQSSSSDDDVVMECNVCGNLQTHEDQR